MDSSTAGLAAIIACALMFGWFAVRWAWGPRTEGEVVDEASAAEASTGAPKCRCCEDADATRALPSVARRVVTKSGERFTSYTRDSSVSQDLSGFVALHQREVCESCGHRADAAVDTFILERVKGTRAKSNDLIEQGVARFERGGLLNDLRMTAISDDAATTPRAEMASVTSLRPGLKAQGR